MSDVTFNYEEQKWFKLNAIGEFCDLVAQETAECPIRMQKNSFSIPTSRLIPK